MTDYDVIVVGAGPAGLMAARKAAEKGAKVLLIEKNKTLGARACGEAISGRTISDAEVGSAAGFICNKVKGAVVYAPDETKSVKIFAGEIGFEEGFIIEKPIFLRKLAHLATVKGADIWVNSEVIDVLVENQKVSGVKVKKNGEEVNLKAKIIIGCDGINSLCARRLFNREGYKLIPCIQYRMANCKLEDEHVLEVFVGQNIAPYGYAWIFPKGNGTANVGIGVRKGQAKVYLDKFISNHPEKFKNAKIIELGAGAVPVGGQIPNIVNKNVVLCGDAAGQVIPLTGGGIHSSIAAGKTAGEIAGEVAKSKNEKIDLSGYPQKYNEYWGKRIASSLKALKVMEKLSDDELNKLAEILSGKDIVDLADGFDVKRVGKELLKHPLFALKIAKALLSG